MAHEELNEYFQQLLGGDRSQLLPDDLREKCTNDAHVMSSVGVQNPEDQRTFWMVFHGTPGILEELMGQKPSMEDVARVASGVYSKRDNSKLHNLVGLFDAVAREANECRMPVSARVISRIKAAYPASMPGRDPLPGYDLGKWMQATRDIYVRMRERNSDFSESFNHVTKGWVPVEKVDYKQWLKLYQGGVPDKYPKLAATAQYYESPSAPGFFVPNPVSIDSLKSKIPSPIGPNRVETEEDRASAKEKEISDRDKIETQRAKIISRLNAAEKLLASMDGQYFAGDMQELMLKLLQDLKRKVQTANKIHVKSSLFEDLIHREANRLRKSGHGEPAEFIEKIAQDPMMDPLGGLGGPPAGGGDTGPDPAAGEDAKEGTQKAIHEMSEFMQTGKVDPDDEKEEREELKEQKEASPPAQPQAQQPPPAAAPPAPAAPAAAPSAAMASRITAEGDIIVEAQEAPLPAAPPTAPPPEPPVDAGEITSEEETDVPAPVAPDQMAGTDEKTDDIIEAALKNVNVNDVIKRLEMLVTIYNQREIPRQMSILDIMMHRLGLASLFPGLGEAMGKALESHQYIGTRLEDILTRLKGSIENEAAIEWTEPQQDSSPQTQAIKRNLEDEKAKEDLRRENRKKRELEKAQQGAGVGAQAPGELQGPARIERTPPTPTR